MKGIVEPIYLLNQYQNKYILFRAIKLTDIV